MDLVDVFSGAGALTTGFRWGHRPEALSTFLLTPNSVCIVFEFVALCVTWLQVPMVLGRAGLNVTMKRVASLDIHLR